MGCVPRLQLGTSLIIERPLSYKWGVEPAPSQRRVLVTGGARGVGAAVAREMASAGYQVAVIGRSAEGLELFAQALAQESSRPWTYVCDLAAPESIEEMTAALEEALGGVDIIVNNAGVAGAAPHWRLDLSHWEQAMAVNARAPALLAAAFVPGMTARGFGRVINMGSVVSLEGARYVSAYAASKHALLGWARCLALELAGSGVTVSTLCPGYIDTPIFHSALANTLARYDQDEERATAAILKSAGQSRLLSPQEVARWVRVLAQEGASSNGEAIRLCP